MRAGHQPLAADSSRGGGHPRLPVSARGIIAIYRGAGGIRDIGTASTTIRDVALHQGLSVLEPLAFCWTCDDIYSVEDGSHCARCQQRLASTLAWPVWSPRLRLRFTLEAFTMVLRWRRRGHRLPG